ncbi:hypothetical protein HD884_001647 [Ochrobactrum intermedium]|nr:hypothetical protein [Brucella intermedia]
MFPAFFQHGGYPTDRQIDDLVLFHVEHHTTKQRRGCIIKMNDGLTCTAQGFESACDEVSARLGEHLNGHIVRYQFLFDQPTNKVELRLRSGRKRNLDFLETDFQKHAIETHLLFAVHRVGERLIAIAQVRRDPARRLRQPPVRPLAIRQFDRRYERTIFAIRVWHHDNSSFGCESSGFDNWEMGLTAGYDRRDAIRPNGRR